MARTERVAPADEKITVNLSPVDLGSVDMLVSEGLYSSRTDLIRAAVRRQLDEHRTVLQDAVTRRSFTVGYLRYGRKELEAAARRKQRISVRVVGVLQIARDVPPALAAAVFDRVSVLGAFKAPPEVAAALADRVSIGGRPASKEER